MANRLSHSQINRHLQCQESWRLHYKLGFRPIEIGSALVFGSAIGKTFEYALTEKKPDEQILTNKEKFDYEWNFQTVNDVLTNLKESKDISYSKYDIDYDLLTQDDLAEAKGDQKLLGWLSLRHKAHAIINTFETEFLPLVKKVYSTEEKIELSNETGDSSIGYADVVADLEGYAKPIILDFKTASREYEQDSVVKSIQLAQYVHVLGEKYDTRLCGYVVFLKNILKNKTKICTKCNFDGTGATHKTCNNTINSKRCNGDWKITLNTKAHMQIIVDEMPEHTENFVIGNIENVNLSINSGVFTRNVNSCFDNGYGRPCEFQKYCWEGKMDGLVKMEKKNEN